MVMGNHEFDHRTFPEELKLARAEAARFGVHLLEDEAVVLAGVRFAGATLWTQPRFPRALVDLHQQGRSESASSCHRQRSGGSIMADSQASLVPSHDAPDPHRQIDSAAWAVFFIWLGVVMLAGLPWGWFLVGVGVLILGAQMVRTQRSLKVDRFGVVIGVIILAAGLWDLLALPLPLMPMILIVLGGYLLWKTLSTTESP